ncbi:MAG: hypothetical protein ING65_12740 [Rhodocyclaceae bacterium]|nr:hypothetical protein [Rhodocyclaceae bacterium]
MHYQWARRFIEKNSNKTRDEQIKLLTDRILQMDEDAEDNKWDMIQDEVEGRPINADKDEYKRLKDAEIIDCCDKLNELIGESKDRSFFPKIFRKGANPSTMYMDGKNDFSELRKSELYNGDEDLALDLL